MDHSHNSEYQIGNFDLTFNGDKAQIYSQGNHYLEEWKFYRLLGDKLSRINLTDQKVMRINDSVQNTVGQDLVGGGLKISTTYALSVDKGLDMSASILNNNSSNVTIETIFSLVEPYSEEISEYGLSNARINTNQIGVYNETTPLNKASWGIDQLGGELSWKTQFSIYSGGLIHSSIFGDSIGLSFGPLAIPNGSGYFIDPTLKPDIIIGHGGGGPFPISIGYLTYSYINSAIQTTIAAYTPITLTVNISDMGGYGSATINLYAVTPNYGTALLGSIAVSASGDYQYKWLAQPGEYLSFYASSPQGMFGVYSNYPAYPINVYTLFSQSLGFNQITNPADTYTTPVNVYFNQKLIGSLFEQIASGPTGTSLTQGNDFSMRFSTAYYDALPIYYDGTYYNGYYVGSYYQNVVWYGDSIGDTQATDNFYPSYVSSSFQATSNGSWSDQIYAESLYEAIAGAVALLPDIAPLSVVMAALYPIFFGSSGSLVSYSTPDNKIIVGANASKGTDNSQDFLNDYQGWDSMLKPVFEFSFQGSFYFGYGPSSSYNQNNAILENLGYYTDYDIVAPVFDPRVIYPGIGVSIFMPFNIALA